MLTFVEFVFEIRREKDIGGTADFVETTSPSDLADGHLALLLVNKRMSFSEHLLRLGSRGGRHLAGPA